MASRLLCVAMMAFALLANPCRAEVLAQGDAMGLTLTATDAPIREVLDKLAGEYGVRYPATIVLDRVITGSFAGPIERVVVAVLDGHNYVMRVTPYGIEIAHLSARGVPRLPQASTTSGQTENPSARPAWRTSVSRLGK